MQIAESRRSDSSSPAFMRVSEISCGNVACDPRNQHDFAIVGVGAESASLTPAEAAQPHTTHMSWTPTRTREDVVRMLMRFVDKEFSPRSAAGKMAIDESRTRNIRAVDMSPVEFQGALRAAVISLLAAARPDAPVVRATAPSSGGEYHKLRSVAPLRSVAQVVTAKSTRCGAYPAAGAREWRATVAQQLRKIDVTGAEGVALVKAARLRLDLIEIRNALQAASTKAERQRGGKKAQRGNARAVADRRKDAVREIEETKSAELASLVKTRAYLRGTDHLLAACTATEEIETYIFGERL